MGTQSQREGSALQITTTPNIAELHSPVEHKKRDVFDALIERRMGTSINPPPTPEDRDPATEDPSNENNLDDDDEMDGPVESPNHEDILD